MVNDFPMLHGGALKDIKVPGQLVGPTLLQASTE